MSVQNDALPVTTTCPKCQNNTLQLFDDILTNGVWFHCISCRAHGDIITFSAQIWNIPIPEAADKFANLGLVAKTTVSRRLIEYSRAVTCQRAAADFVFDAYSQLWNHNDEIIACRLRELGVRQETATDIDIVGVAHPDQIRSLCAELGRRRNNFLRASTPSIIFPFYDMPGRLTGVLAVQYTSNKAQHTFIPLSGQRRRAVNAGYFLLDTLYAPPSKPLMHNQFISNDVFWVTKMQLAVITQHGKTIPIAGTHTGEDAISFGEPLAANDLYKTNKIFHGVTITPSLVSNACAARGYVSTALVRQELTPMQQLAQIKTTANTWRRALRDFLKRVKPETGKSVLNRLTIASDKINAFVAENKDVIKFDLVASAPAAFEDAQALNTPRGSKRKITERNSGWWSQSGRHISNVRPVIEEILQLSDGSCFYRGYVHYEQETYEFEESAKTIEKLGLLAYARLLLSGNEKLVLFDSQWNNRSLNIALQLHPPKLTRITNTYGWDATNQSFRFCQYTLDNTGDPLPHKTAKNTYDKLKDFEWPGLVAPNKLHALTTPTEENMFTWLFTAIALSNLLAPVARQNSSSLALCPSQYDAAKALGRALGCNTEMIAPETPRHQMVKIWNNFDCGHWPAMFFGLFSADQLGMWAPSYFDRPLILGVNEPAVASLCSYGWYGITATPTVTTTDYSALRAILPAYIQKVLQNKPGIIKTNTHIIDAVLQNLHEWLQNVYGTTFSLELAKKFLSTPNTAHTAISRVLHDAIADNKIAVLPLPRKRTQTQDYFLKTPEWWWLNRWAINRYFKYAKSPPPNWIAFANLISNDSALIDEKVVYGNPGLLVESRWFDNCRPNDVLVKEDIG